MKKCISRICCATIVLGMFSTTAQAYRLFDYRLKSSLVYVPYSGFAELTRQQFNDALYVWNCELPNGITMTRSVSTHNSAPDVIPQDGRNYIYRLPELDANNSYIAQNRVIDDGKWLGTPAVVESDINFNVNKKFANSAKAGCYDVQTVFLHETGHTLGLDDISSPKLAVMYKAGQTGMERRSLHSDDRNGLAEAYDLG